MIVQAGGIWLTVQVPTYPAWVVGALLQGIGTAMVYPTLLAAISDVAHPEWRATTMGVYRFWRDLGYAIGALISGIIADLLGDAGRHSGCSGADIDFGLARCDQDARDTREPKAEGPHCRFELSGPLNVRERSRGNSCDGHHLGAGKLTAFRQNSTVHTAALVRWEKGKTDTGNR